MFLKRWPVIVALCVIGLACLAYFLGLFGSGAQPAPPSNGVTPMGDPQDSGWVKDIAAIAGAITTLGTAAFAMLSKWTDFRKAQLDIKKAELDLQERAQALAEKQDA